MPTLSRRKVTTNGPPMASVIADDSEHREPDSIQDQDTRVLNWAIDILAMEHQYLGKGCQQMLLRTSGILAVIAFPRRILEQLHRLLDTLGQSRRIRGMQWKL
jgi:hypothetical protein